MPSFYNQEYSDARIHSKRNYILNYTVQRKNLRIRSLFPKLYTRVSEMVRIRVRQCVIAGYDCVRNMFYSHTTLALQSQVPVVPSLSVSVSVTTVIPNGKWILSTNSSLQMGVCRMPKWAIGISSYAINCVRFL